MIIFASTGSHSSNASTENTSPAMVPTAKANQNTSPGPSNRNGIRPSTVERMVSEMGRILREKAWR